MRTTNGLDVPTGWGDRRPADRRPCPVCLRATAVVTNVAGFQVLAAHSPKGRPQCKASGRLVEGR